MSKRPPRELIYSLAFLNGMAEIIMEIGTEEDAEIIRKKLATLVITYLDCATESIDESTPSLYHFAKSHNLSFYRFIDHMKPRYEEVKDHQNNCTCGQKEH